MLASLLVFSVACSSSGSKPSGDATATASNTVSPPDTADSLLFVARSRAGSLTVRAGSESTLELDVDTMSWFSDRPHRDAGRSSVTDALKAFGWERNGDRLGADAPNATLVAAELGQKAVVVELLTATVDGNHVRFTVDFVSPRPQSTVSPTLTSSSTTRSRPPTWSSCRQDSSGSNQAEWFSGGPSTSWANHTRWCCTWHRAWRGLKARW